MTSDDFPQENEPLSGFDALKRYGLMDALLNRRSRRFSRGMEIESGPT